ncbi:MAG: class I SAM-dependent methyltransferase [Coriobacteriia bacterium]|nr:class I SAM-dependent methyltransferase [Coriobacteriia bacterium]
MINAVQSHFDERASYYDDYRRHMIPNFDEYYSIGVDALACTKADPRVLDLGSGTGLSTLYLLKRFPSARVTLFDFSEEMLSVARERFRDNPSIDFVIGDYRSIALTGPFDVVISGLSIHHLSFTEKQELTNKVYDLLVPAGEFLNTDLARGENKPLEQEMHRRLEGFMRENMSEDQIQRFKDSQDMDIPVSIAEHFELMGKAGFRTVDCLYRYWIYGVFYGQK